MLWTICVVVEDREKPSPESCRRNIRNKNLENLTDNS